MAKTLLVSAAETHVGKTLIALGLLLKLQEMGKKVGYFRPFARSTAKDDIDEDAFVVQEMLGLEAPPKSPYTIHFNMFFETIDALGRENILQKIKASYEAIAKDCDVVIIEGNRLAHQFYSFNLCDAEIAKALGAKLLVVTRPKTDVNVDDLLVLCDVAKRKGADVLGVVFTNISLDMIDRTQTLFREKMEERGYPVFGAIPRLSELEAPTVQEVFEVMGGEILVKGSPEKMSSLVENYIIGAMNFASALTYIRRGVNKAVITGGDRSDLLLAALETSVSCLILTGNLRPAPQILAAARENGIPVMLVATDTFHTATKLKKISPRIQVSERDECEKIARKYLDIDAIIKDL